MTPQKITMAANGQLNVPNHPIIPFIEGDGIGPDVWHASKMVLDAAVEKTYGGTRKIEWKEILAGEKAFNKTGEWLPAETLDIARDCLVSIKGPLTTPVGGGIRSLNVAMRQELDLYACVRPVKWYMGVPSPVVHPENVNMVIFRENTEDIYAGIEFEMGSEGAKKLMNFLRTEYPAGAKKVRFPETSAFGIKPVSKEGTERLIRAAIKYALKNKLPTVSIVHKGNIMKYTEGGFKIWGYELAEREFGDQVFTWGSGKMQRRHKEKNSQHNAEKAQAAGKLIINDVIADNFLQQILIAPKDYSVVATLNLNGDYISDAAAAAVGGIGIAPGGNINYLTGHAVFEATHGTAPRFANTNTMNPSSLLLSGVMMLEYMGWHEAAVKIEDALSTTIKRKRVTVDFYNLMNDATLLKTSEFAEEVIKNIKVGHGITKAIIDNTITMSLNLASYIDHTILKQTTTIGEIDKVCVEASLENFMAVCVPPKYVTNVKKMLDGSRVRVATVIGFPLGYNSIETKVQEIEDAIRLGADEVDMVIDLGALKNGDWGHLTSEIEACMKPVYAASKVIKVIVESGILTDDELIACCELHGKYEIDFMKTSTGFAEKGASVHAVELMREHLPKRIAIKASGGIRSYAFAKELIDAGATWLGCSASMQIMKEFREAH